MTTKGTIDVPSVCHPVIAIPQPVFRWLRKVHPITGETESITLQQGHTISDGLTGWVEWRDVPIVEEPGAAT